MVSLSRPFSDSSADIPLAVVRSRPSTPPNPKPSPGSPTSYRVASPSRIGVIDNWHTAGNLTQGVPGAHVRRTAAPVALPKKPKAKAYVVYQGRAIGVFTQWYVLVL